MKKFNVILSVPLIAMIAVVTSCSDDDEVKTKTDLLTSKNWSFTSVSLKSDKTEVEASDEFLSGCEKDDILTFSKDGVYKSDVGTDDCDGDTSDETGTWKWNADETVLTISSDNDGSDFELVSLTSTTLKINVGTMDYDANGDGIDDTEASIIYTLTAK